MGTVDIELSLCGFGAFFSVGRRYEVVWGLEQENTGE